MSFSIFAIKISSTGKGGFSLSVIDSPAGEASDTVDRMVDPKSLSLLRTSLGRARDLITAKSKDRTKIEDPVELRTLLEKVGEELFASLIPRGIRHVWDESRGRVAAAGDRLRLEIHIDPSDTALLPVANLPWELVFHVGSGVFLGLDLANTIVRYLDVGRPARGAALGRPLKVLVAESRPVDQVGLDLDLETDTLVGAWQETPGVEILSLPKTTSKSLRARLKEDQPQVLHFMGHGYFDSATGWGGLVLETEDGLSASVGGPDLRDLFQGIPGLELVVLNACDTARQGSEAQPFAGAAAGLMLAGIPAVVAMQFPISDSAAIVFCEALYRSLAAGYGIDESVVEGRMAIRLDDRQSLEWVTPVLFMRGGERQREAQVSAQSELSPQTLSEYRESRCRESIETGGMQAHFENNIKGNVGSVENIGYIKNMVRGRGD